MKYVFILIYFPGMERLQENVGYHKMKKIKCKLSHITRAIILVIKY